jgi:hypothetical protein
VIICMFSSTNCHVKWFHFYLDAEESSDENDYEEYDASYDENATDRFCQVATETPDYSSTDSDSKYKEQQHMKRRIGKSVLSWSLIT